MKLTVNGEEREVPAGLNISELLEHLKIRAPQVAVEVNRSIVPRNQHVTHLLAESDAVEIVAFVGGG